MGGGFSRIKATKCCFLFIGGGGGGGQVGERLCGGVAERELRYWSYFFVVVLGKF